jgi:hypothetical protein
MRGREVFAPPQSLNHMNVRRHPRDIVAVLLLAAGWLAGVAVPPMMLLRARTAWLETLDRPEAQEQWDEFREDMKRQTGRDGPVQRKVPKSPEPPMRVWLRDHVGLAITAWVVLAGVLGSFTAMLVWGALKPPSGRSSLAQDQPGRGGDDEEKNDRDAEDAQIRKHGS